MVIGNPVFTSPGLGIIARPEVSFACRDERWSYDPNAKWYDEDHDQDEKPVKQSIFTNLNDALNLMVSAGTLVGRTSPGRGLAQTIQPAAPLYVADFKLQIDSTVLLTRIAQLEARATALEHLVLDPDSFLNVGFYPDTAALPTPPNAPPGVTVLAYDNGANKLKIWDPGSSTWKNA